MQKKKKKKKKKTERGEVEDNKSEGDAFLRE